jgi:hypothetical protein
VVVVVTALALFSAWHSGGHVWNRLSTEQQQYAAYSDVQRAHAPIDHVGLPSDVFDFYRDRLVRGDRIYFDVAPGGYGQFFDLPGIVAALGQYYLLPAVQVSDLEHATVVLSYDTDPAKLGVHFPTQDRAGQQLIFVSRLRSP